MRSSTSGSTSTRVNGRSLVESVDPVAAGLGPLETEVLQAHVQSRTSFLATEAVDAGEHQIWLRDLLDPGQPEVVLTDMGFSDSMRRAGIALALFTRLVTVRGITMTGGFSFGFEAECTPGILQAYRQRMKKVLPAEASEARFVFFFRKHLQLGIEQEYQDVA